MNIFRLAGDMSHLLSILVLLLKIRATKSCRGEVDPRVDGPGRPAGLPYADAAIAHRIDVRQRSRRARPPTSSQCAAGISLKTQELYALVFVCRYLDLFYSFISV